MVITIDGPVASGKSTAARKLAARIGYYHFSSGLLYRALGYLLVHDSNYTLDRLYSPDPQDIEYYLAPERFVCTFDAGGKFHILWKGTDLVPLLKDKQIDQWASIISMNSLVRDRMLALQRLLGRTYNLVVDGRDSGSVVFPDAKLKFFLTASLEVRAKRWQQTQQSLGNTVSLSEVLHEIQERDERDKNREIAPLIVPENAIIIDNSGQSVHETVEWMVSYY